MNAANVAVGGIGIAIGMIVILRRKSLADAMRGPMTNRRAWLVTGLGFVTFGLASVIDGIVG